MTSQETALFRALAVLSTLSQEFDVSHATASAPDLARKLGWSERAVWQTVHSLKRARHLRQLEVLDDGRLVLELHLIPFAENIPRTLSDLPSYPTLPQEMREAAEAERNMGIVADPALRTAEERAARIEALKAEYLAGVPSKQLLRKHRLSWATLRKNLPDLPRRPTGRPRKETA